MRDRESLMVWLDRARATDTRKLALLAFVLGAFITMMYRPFSQLEVGDAAIYDYVAQSILRGQVPYRDVIDIKGPLATQLSALAIVVGKAVGVRDLLAIRLFHVLLVGFLSAVIFLVGEAYFRSRAVGLIAFLIPMMFPSFIEMMIAGTQPKLPMMVFGMLSLLLIAKDRPFWAGFCSMLSCLCWQPGLMFAGVAFLMFSRYLTIWRDLRGLKVIAGALTPLAVTLAYFYSRGALGEMWAWTITYNYSVFGPSARRSFGEAGGHLWRITYRVFQPDIFLLCGSGLGLLIFLAERLRTKIRERSAWRAPDLFRDAVVIPPLIYLGFCFINIQGGPDLIPLVPFVGIFAARLLVQAGRAAAQSRFAGNSASLRRLEVIVPGFAMVVILLLGLYRSAAYKLEGWTLEHQDKAMVTVSSLLGPGDKIFVHGTVEILTLLNKPNLNPYVDLDWGKDDYIAARRYGGSFEALIDEMEAQAPKLVSLTRLRKVYRRAELEKWVQDHYDKLESFTYEPLYIRKQ